MMYYQLIILWKQFVIGGVKNVLKGLDKMIIYKMVLIKNNDIYL